MGSFEQSMFWKLLHASAWEWGGLIVVLIVMIGGILQIRAWLQDENDPAELDQVMLTEITDLKRQGELSQEEYQSIKQQLARRLNSTENSSESAVDSRKPSQVDSQPE